MFSQFLAFVEDTSSARYDVESLGLKVISGSKLEKTLSKNLSLELSTEKHNLLIDYGEFGAHLPDVCSESMTTPMFKTKHQQPPTTER